MEIGNRIAERRKALKLSQEQLAAKADISQTHISKIELGKDNPSLKLLKSIAKVLGCSLYIDLIPEGTSAKQSNIASQDIAIEQKQESAPTWFAIEQASAATILSIAIEKMKLEKKDMTDAERKTLEGLIETCKEVMEI